MQERPEYNGKLICLRSTFTFIIYGFHFTDMDDAIV